MAPLPAAVSVHFSQTNPCETLVSSHQIKDSRSYYGSPLAIKSNFLLLTEKPIIPSTLFSATSTYTINCSPVSVLTILIWSFIVNFHALNCNVLCYIIFSITNYSSSIYSKLAESWPPYYINTSKNNSIFCSKIHTLGSECAYMHSHVYIII